MKCGLVVVEVVEDGIGVVGRWRESKAMISPLVVPRGKVGGRFVVGVPRSTLPRERWPLRGALVVLFESAFSCLVFVTAARRLERSCSIELEL